MTRRKTTAVTSKPGSASGAAPAMPGLDQRNEAVDTTPNAVLHQLAEELGRMVARRLGGGRKAYGLIEILVGVVAMAIAMLIMFHAMHR